MEDETELLLTDEVEEQDDEQVAPFVGFGDDEEDDAAPDLPKRLREELKDRARKLAAANRELEELRSKSGPTPVDVGPRPSLADFDYDEDKHGAAVDEWAERKAAAALQTANTPDPDQALKIEVEQDWTRLQSGVRSLKYADGTAVAEEAATALTPVQQFAIASVAKDPAMFLYALGKNPAKLGALSGIRNAAKFAGEVARLEIAMTVGKKTTPAVERVVRGNGAPTASTDKELAKLEAEAEKTGNRTALIAYKKSKKAA